MKYYILDVKAEPIFPQLNCISQEHAHRLQHGEFPNFVPKLVFRFEKGVKHTDILSQASINASGFLINEKVKNILSDSI